MQPPTTGWYKFFPRIRPLLITLVYTGLLFLFLILLLPSNVPVNAISPVAYSGEDTENYPGGTVPTQPPGIPIGLMVSQISPNALTLTWQPGAGDAPAGYRLYRRVRENPLYEYWLPIRNEIRERSVTVDGLIAGTQYHFALSALSATGEESGKTPIVSAWTHQAPLAYHPGSGPAVAVVGERFYYQVAAIGVPAPTFTLLSGPTAMAVDTTTGLVEWVPGAGDIGVVRVTVRAHNVVGTDDHPFFITVRAEVPDTTAPTPTRLITATAITAHGGTLYWEAATDNVGIAGYQIFAQENVHGGQLFPAADTTVPTTTVSLHTLRPATSYRLWVAAYDAAGNIASISGIPATTLTTRPGETETPISGLAVQHDGPTLLGLPTYLTATVITGDNVQYTWAFDDNHRYTDRVTTGAIISHTFALSGTRGVTVTAANSHHRALVTTTLLIIAAPPANSNQLQILPPMPTPTDPITITLTGIYPHSCTPAYVAHAITSNIILLHSQSSPELFCLPVETGWGYVITVGPLAAARYTVVHQLDHAIVDAATFTVTSPISSAAPVILTDRIDEQPLEATAAEPFTYQVRAVGAGPLAYAVTDAPTGLTIDPTTGEIAWTPPATASGTVTFTVQVSNDVGRDEYTYHLTIHRVDGPPIRILLPFVLR